MQGRAFAISPGLYTMVAIEKTEVRDQRTFLSRLFLSRQCTNIPNHIFHCYSIKVENLEPPWGNCTEEKPMYYDKFTVSACQMDCENKLARDKCSCLNINMPKKDDGKCRNVSKLWNLVYRYYLLTMGGSNGGARDTTLSVYFF